MNTVLADTVHPKCMHTLTQTSTKTLSFSLSWHGELVCVVPMLAKIIRRYLQAWSCMNALFPSFHNMMCFLFCVCFDPSLVAKLCRGEARVRVALLLFLAAAVVGGCWGERRQKGDSMKPKNQGCLKDFCLKELLCNDQSLIMDVCAPMREYTHTEKDWHAHSFI